MLTKKILRFHLQNFRETRIRNKIIRILIENQDFPSLDLDPDPSRTSASNDFSHKL